MQHSVNVLHDFQLQMAAQRREVVQHQLYTPCAVRVPLMIPSMAPKSIGTVTTIHHLVVREQKGLRHRRRRCHAAILTSDIPIEVWASSAVPCTPGYHPGRPIPTSDVVDSRADGTLDVSKPLFFGYRVANVMAAADFVTRGDIRPASSFRACA